MLMLCNVTTNNFQYDNSMITPEYNKMRMMKVDYRSEKVNVTSNFVKQTC